MDGCVGCRCAWFMDGRQRYLWCVNVLVMWRALRSLVRVRSKSVVRYPMQVCFVPLCCCCCCCSCCSCCSSPPTLLPGSGAADYGRMVETSPHTPQVSCYRHDTTALHYRAFPAASRILLLIHLKLVLGLTPRTTTSRVSRHVFVVFPDLAHDVVKGVLDVDSRLSRGLDEFATKLSRELSALCVRRRMISEQSLRTCRMEVLISRKARARLCNRRVHIHVCRPKKGARAILLAAYLLCSLVAQTPDRTCFPQRLWGNNPCL